MSNLRITLLLQAYATYRSVGLNRKATTNLHIDCITIGYTPISAYA